MGFSISHGQNYSTRYIFTQTCGWVWAGLAYSLLLVQHSMDTKSSSKSQSQSSGLDWFCALRSSELLPNSDQLYLQLFSFDNHPIPLRLLYWGRHCLRWQAQNILSTSPSFFLLRVPPHETWFLLSKIVSERISLSSRTVPVKGLSPPSYSLSVSYVRSSSSGKSLLAKGKTQRVQGYNAFFDEEGTLDQEILEKWVGELVEEAMEGKQSW